jgi:hypothetical protein
MGIIKGSNREGPGGDRRNNGFLPLSGGAPTVHPANRTDTAGDRRNGSFPLGASGGIGVALPNDTTFRAGDKGLSSPHPTAVSPGKGMVPVEPGGSTALKVSDMAPPKGGR